MDTLNSLPAIVPAERNWFSNVAVWLKFRVTIDSIGVATITAPDRTQTTEALPAGLTHDVPICDLPGRAFAENVRMKTALAFTGTTTLTGKLGTSGDDDRLIAGAYDLKAAVTATNFTPVTGEPSAEGQETTAATKLVLLLTATVDNLNQTATGEVDIWVRLALLP